MELSKLKYPAQRGERRGKLSVNVTAIEDPENAKEFIET